MYEHRLYAIVPVAALTRELVAQCIQSDLTTVRRSSDGRAVIKWNAKRDAKPDALVGRIEVLTRDEMLTELAATEWNESQGLGR